MKILTAKTRSFRKRQKKSSFFFAITLFAFLVLVTVHQGCGGSGDRAEIPPSIEEIVEPPIELRRFPYEIKGKATNGNLEFEIKIGLYTALEQITAAGSQIRKISAYLLFLWKLDKSVCGIPPGIYRVERTEMEIEVGDDNSRIYIPSFQFSSASYTFSSSREFSMLKDDKYGENFPYTIINDDISFQRDGKSCQFHFN